MTTETTTEKKRRRQRGTDSLYQIHRPSCARPPKGCACIWWISYRGPDGKRQAETLESLRKGDAQRLLQRRVGARENNLPVIPRAEQLTFNAAAQAAIDDLTANGKKSLNVAKLRIEKHLTPYFAGRRLAGITMADVTAYISHRQKQGVERERDVPVGDKTERQMVRVKGVTNATINRELQILKRIYSLAIKSGRIAMKPHIPLLREDNVRTGFFEQHQLDAVLARLPAHLQPVVQFAHITGWRVASEVVGLEWRNVDFRAGEVRLDVGSTKNGEGRTFPMTAALRTLLKSQHTEHERLKKAEHIVPWVFVRMVAKGRRGPKEPRRIYSFTKAWKTACAAAGVPGRILHDFRRTGVRNLVRAGVPERVAMTMTGHKTRNVFDRYNIVSGGDLKEAARKLDAATPGTAAAAS